MGSRNTYRIDGKERDDPLQPPAPPSTTLPSSRPFLITRPRCFQAGALQPPTPVNNSPVLPALPDHATPMFSGRAAPAGESIHLTPSYLAEPHLHLHDIEWTWLRVPHPAAGTSGCSCVLCWRPPSVNLPTLASVIAYFEIFVGVSFISCPSISRSVICSCFL
jgi:hypothetical protein